MGPGLGKLLPNLVYAHATGANVFDTDGNRYVDLAAGFGAQLLGHCHAEITQTIAQQAAKLTQALGDVFPTPERIELQERLAALMGQEPHRVILGQSGADAITAALKTAVLATGRPGVVAFGGAYHGLSYAPLALCQLRNSYRQPFSEQLNPHVHVLAYPANATEAEQTASKLDALLANQSIGAVVVEPILGRGGCVVPPEGFLSQLVELCREHDTVSIVDEIWTGLGRAGAMLVSSSLERMPDIICLGKGLGGGLPLSACIGKAGLMQAWARPSEVVHTATFSGSPLAAAAGLRLLDILERDGMVQQCAQRGQRWIASLRNHLGTLPRLRAIRGRGFMLGLDLGSQPGIAAEAAKRLLSKGWIVTTGGGAREVMVLTPPLTISDELLDAATQVLRETLEELAV
jgi:4-aminobutyrate aminotransferase / (S)-3-amino-2-methylpropionate transaminase / 5-aminovalerate transaminase